MSSLLPRERSPDSPDTEPRVLGFEERESTAVFDALSSGVARAVLARLLEEPATQSELADGVGTSIQNVSYHVDKLQSAELIEVVDEWYSEKGTGMDVYAPVHDSVVLVAGERTDSLREAGVETAPAGPPPGPEE